MKLAIIIKNRKKLFKKNELIDYIFNDIIGNFDKKDGVDLNNVNIMSLSFNNSEELIMKIYNAFKNIKILNNLESDDIEIKKYAYLIELEMKNESDMNRQILYRTGYYLSKILWGKISIDFQEWVKAGKFYKKFKDIIDKPLEIDINNIEIKYLNVN